ncbi:CXXC-rich protein [Entamoeba marina]
MNDECIKCSLNENCERTTSVTCVEKTCSSCNSTKYILNAENVCESNNIYCEEYSGMYCEKCIYGFNFDTMSTCIDGDIDNCFEYDSKGQCIKCVDNLSYDSSTQQCSSCNVDNCNSCSYTDPDICSICSTGYSLTSDYSQCIICNVTNCEYCDASDSNKCVSCIGGYYIDTDYSCSLQDIDNCITYGEGNTCEQCDDEYVLYDGICEECEVIDCKTCSSSICDECLSGFIYNGSGSCIQCQDNCDTCGYDEETESITECTKCKDGFGLVDGSCLQCNSGCKYCDNDNDKCSTCYDNYFMKTDFTCGKCNDNCVAAIIGSGLCVHSSYECTTIVTDGCIRFDKNGGCIECENEYYTLKDNICYSYFSSISANKTVMGCYKYDMSDEQPIFEYYEPENNECVNPFTSESTTSTESTTSENSNNEDSGHYIMVLSFILAITLLI